MCQDPLHLSKYIVSFMSREMPPDSLTVIFIQLFQVNCCHLFFEQHILLLTDTYTLNLYSSYLIHVERKEWHSILCSYKTFKRSSCSIYNSFMLLMIFWDIRAAVGEEQSPPIVCMIIFFSSHCLVSLSLIISSLLIHPLCFVFHLLTHLFSVSVCL